MAEIAEQYFSYDGEWVQVPTTSAALEAQVRSLREEVEALRLLITRGGRAD